jgi:eukaryotic-like serine/threonine-protein kinase
MDSEELDVTQSAARDEMLFLTALALPPAERDLYLERACGDSDTHARVHALLDACDRSLALMRDDAVDRLSGDGLVQVDNYRTIEDLGEGGWGAVYRAEQISPLRREVALKIIKLGMDTKAVIIRFEAERQALAMMDHPNIAKVFDAGATDAGRPYFAMELVRGVKITQYCDSIRASVAERLALFIQVCQAIQHAHRKGIIHRDIKPSNVMVTLCDGEAVVKVIDFGVAKAIQSGPPENTMLTVFGAFVGTPAYVSPEQMDYGARIDARSDIYSLGVLLHEMLCGCTPFDSGDLSASALNALRIRIRSEEVSLPSKLLKSLPAEASHKAADSCRTTRSGLIGQLQGDLDWIVMRCLEKDAGKRYQSAREISADLQRYLRDEPVVARPRRLLYSFAKFTKRHRMVFVTGAAIITALLITSALSSWVAVRATRANRLAQSVATFLQNDLLAQSTFGLPLQSALDRAAEKVGERFAHEPLVEAPIRDILGTVYDSIGAASEAQPQFEKALAIYYEQYGIKDRRTLAAMAKVAAAAAKQAHYDEAERMGMRALRHCREILGHDNFETLALATTMARVLFEQGNIEGSHALLDEFMETQRTVLGADHSVTLEGMWILASIKLQQDRLAEALELALPVYEARARTLGRRHVETRIAEMTLAMISRRSGKCVVADDSARASELTYNEVVGVAAPRGGFGQHSLDDPGAEPWQCVRPTRPR